MADPIVVRLRGGGTATFPPDFSPEQIELELQRLDASQIEPDHSVAGYINSGVNWLGTRAIKAATGALQAPAALERYAEKSVGDLFEGVGMRRPPPVAKEMPSPLDMAALLGQFSQRWIFDRIPEVNAPGRLGRILDSGIEAALLMPLGGAGTTGLFPAFVGGAGSEAAGQMAEGTSWEGAARLLGSVLGASTGALGPRYASQVGKTFVEPTTQRGGDAIVGRALNRAAHDPRSATANMDAYHPTVRRSFPTAAQAADDQGLLAAEHALHGRNQSPFDLRAAQNDAARMAAIDRVVAEGSHYYNTLGRTARQAKEADVRRLMDEFKASVQTSTDDVLGNKVLSPANAARWWQANKSTAANVLPPAQVRAVQAIVDDFAIGARGPHGVGPQYIADRSLQNLASGNMLDAILRSRAVADSAVAQAIVRPLQFLYRLPEARLQELLITAMLDPRTASALMTRASTGNAKLLAPMLEQILLGGAAGASRLGLDVPSPTHQKSQATK